MFSFFHYKNLGGGKWKIIGTAKSQILVFYNRIAENIFVYDDPISVNFNVVKKYKLVQKPTQKQRTQNAQRLHPAVVIYRSRQGGYEQEKAVRDKVDHYHERISFV